MLLVPKNWASFQHYKDRSPPWVKLHKELLDDRTFQRLPVASRALAPMLWLLASESKDGSFDGSVEELAFRLRCSEEEIESGLSALIDKGFFLPASKPLAKRKPAATPETEAETETEAKKSPRKARATSLPDGFKTSERVQAWATAKGYRDLDLQLEAFVSYAKRKGATYVDWDEALMTAIRDDWAKARKGSGANPAGVVAERFV